MATITRENIGLLHDKLTVTVSPADYQAAYEQSLKKYAKSANIPGFRKGMVPAGLIKKMYGQGIFADEVLKTMEKELNNYLTNEKLNIFAQPLPAEGNQPTVDVNNLTDYAFEFEIGLQPDFDLNLDEASLIKYKITVTDAMIDEDVARLQTRNGNMTEPEVVESEDTVLNVTFTETDAEGNVVENGLNKANSLLVKYFAESFRPNLMGKKKDDIVSLTLSEAFEDKELATILGDLGLDAANAENAAKKFVLTITKLGLVEKAAIDEKLFAASFPNKTIGNEAEFRAAVAEEIQAYFDAQAANQLHDQIYHHLLDNTTMSFPENFLKRWLQVGGEKPKTAEEAEAEMPSFLNSVKWTLISNKLMQQHNVQVLPDDLKAYAKQQLLGYLGNQMGSIDGNESWIEDYANRMVKDKKFVEDSYNRISTEKMFTAVAAVVKTTEEAISVEAFSEKLHNHHH
ncbi:MAG: trigger factor [Chitinophagaceae bacterium]